MWSSKTFKTHAEMKSWIADNDGEYQWIEVFINNGYCVEFRKLVEPRLPR